MSTSQPYVIQIIKPNTKLRTNKRISRWLQFPCDTVGLETIDTSCHIVYILPPSCYCWIPFNCSTRNSCWCKWFLKAFPCLTVAHFLFFSFCLSDEGILSNAVAVSTSVSFFTGSPVIVITFGALMSAETYFLKYFHWVKVFRVFGKFWFS